METFQARAGTQSSPQRTMKGAVTGERGNNNQDISRAASLTPT